MGVSDNRAHVRTSPVTISIAEPLKLSMQCLTPKACFNNRTVSKILCSRGYFGKKEEIPFKTRNGMKTVNPSGTLLILSIIKKVRDVNTSDKRFSLSTPVEQVWELVAVHNLNEQKVSVNYKMYTYLTL